MSESEDDGNLGVVPSLERILCDLKATDRVSQVLSLHLVHRIQWRGHLSGPNQGRSRQGDRGEYTRSND